MSILIFNNIDSWNVFAQCSHNISEESAFCDV